MSIPQCPKKWEEHILCFLKSAYAVFMPVPFPMYQKWPNVTIKSLSNNWPYILFYLDIDT